MTTSQTTSQRYYLGARAAMLAVLACTLIVYPQLPSIVPMHWDAHGQVNGWGPKWWLVSLRGSWIDRPDRPDILRAAVAFAEEVRSGFIPRHLSLHHDDPGRIAGLHPFARARCRPRRSFRYYPRCCGRERAR